MAVTGNKIVTPQSINQTGVQFVNSDGTTKKDVVTAGSNGTIVRGLSGQTTDTSANNVFLYIYDGSTDFPVGCCRVPAGSGNDGATVSKDLLNNTDLPWLKIDANGNPILVLKGGYKLKASCLAAVTTAKTLTLFPFAEDL